MVAYSFKRRFVVPIARGLGVPYPIDFVETLVDRPKHQTIRAIGRRRHARAGEQLQLYQGMRTPKCFLIGRAVCVDVLPIDIHFATTRRRIERVIVGETERRHASELDAFAGDDGFSDWAEMREFWRENHPGIVDFAGRLILWRAGDA